MIRIAVDAMGGDHAPGVVVEGVLLAAKELDVEIVLVGQKEAVEGELARHPGPPPTVRTLHASETVGMHDSPSSSLRKKDSSIGVAFDLAKRKEVDAVVSAGNSGAMLASGIFVLGKLPYIERPAILVAVPSRNKRTVLIDAGANVECKPRHLLQFALMGSIYAERVLGVPKPRVGIVSNGEEDAKGNDLTRAANEQLKATSLNTVGYVEGRDISDGTVDVVVCDGFTGNVILKTMEGFASFLMGELKRAYGETLLSRLGYRLSRGSLHRALTRLDYAEYGGAQLLGLDGVAIVAHGGSGPKAIKNAIRVAKESVDCRINFHIEEGLKGLEGLAAEKKEGFFHKVTHQLRSKLENLGERTTAKSQESEIKSEGKR